MANCAFNPSPTKISMHSCKKIFSWKFVEMENSRKKMDFNLLTRTGLLVVEIPLFVRVLLDYLHFTQSWSYFYNEMRRINGYQFSILFTDISLISFLYKLQERMILLENK